MEMMPGTRKYYLETILLLSALIIHTTNVFRDLAVFLGILVLVRRSPSLIMENGIMTGMTIITGKMEKHIRILQSVQLWV
ncbi:hypothetical protein [Sphingobacterium sp.]|uniref:hypothetical protein n=1 Tax=Sphingobacterium sp. TaxID=341027 RepID=UPI0028A17063|nr:hypothetical protein [Sphingobacterium sp.]